MLAGFFHIFVRCNDPPMKNIRFGLCIPACLFALFCSQQASPQGYVKLNVPYALVGVVNPAVEFAISPKSTLQTDIVISPWKSINEKHMLFAIFMGEYRRYFKEHNRGWYLGANIGMMAFDMSKPYIEGWKLKFEDRYCKGYGMMIGLCVGYEYQFGKRWLLDAFLGWAWMDSHYNGYSFDGQVDMYPHRPVQPEHPDPFNGSSEWYPNKIGVSIGLSPDRGGVVAGVPRKGPLQFTPGLGSRAGRCFRLPAFREYCSLWFRSCGLSVHGCLPQSATAV